MVVGRPPAAGVAEFITDQSHPLSRGQLMMNDVVEETPERTAIRNGFHVLFVVCLPVVYFGRHWATDIVAGAGVALATVPMVNEVLRRSSLVPRLLGWSERRPAAFYSVFFLCSMDIAMDFAFVKTALKLVSILQLVRGVHITRVVMWIVTGTAPA